MGTGYAKLYFEHLRRRMESIEKTCSTSRNSSFEVEVYVIEGAAESKIIVS